MPRLLALALPVILILLCCLASGQDDSVSSCPFFPNEEVQAHNLPSLTAPAKNKPAVFATALEITLHDKAVCCGKDSALEDALLADPRSLQELSGRIQGKHFLNDGRPIVVNAEYIPRTSANSGLIIRALLDQRAPLIEWKSHVYVLHGAIFNESRCPGGGQYAIVKLLLVDPRFSDERRDVVFNRETDDWEKVQGLMIPVVAPQ